MPWSQPHLPPLTAFFSWGRNILFQISGGAYAQCAPWLRTPLYIIHRLMHISLLKAFHYWVTNFHWKCIKLYWYGTILALNLNLPLPQKVIFFLSTGLFYHSSHILNNNKKKSFRLPFFNKNCTRERDAK